MTSIPGPLSLQTLGFVLAFLLPPLLVPPQQAAVIPAVDTSLLGLIGLRLGMGLLALAAAQQGLSKHDSKHQTRRSLPILVIGLGLGLAMVLGAMILIPAINQVFADPGNPLADNVQELTLAGLAAFALLACLAAFSEEALYRTYLLSRMQAWGAKPYQATTVGALIFGLAHAYQGPGPLTISIMYGIVLGWAWFRYHSLWLVVLAHLVYNISGLLSFVLGSS